MMSYQKLEAWKTCHALVLAVYQATEGKHKQDPDLIERLRYTAMRAASKIAFGSGTGHRKMFMRAVMYSAGYLAEFTYHLTMARVMGILPERACSQLDGLRGRATFYTRRLLDSFILPSRGTDKDQPSA
jgi:four helix bundle protein